jgi:hypothetical protein
MDTRLEMLHRRCCHLDEKFCNIGHPADVAFMNTCRLASILISCTTLSLLGTFHRFLNLLLHLPKLSLPKRHMLRHQRPHHPFTALHPQFLLAGPTRTHSCQFWVQTMLLQRANHKRQTRLLPRPLIVLRGLGSRFQGEYLLVGDAGDIGLRFDEL